MTSPRAYEERSTIPSGSGQRCAVQPEEAGTAGLGEDEGSVRPGGSLRRRDEGSRKRAARIRAGDLPHREARHRAGPQDVPRARGGGLRRDRGARKTTPDLPRSVVAAGHETPPTARTDEDDTMALPYYVSPEHDAGQGGVRRKESPKADPSSPWSTPPASDRGGDPAPRLNKVVGAVRIASPSQGPESTGSSSGCAKRASLCDMKGYATVGRRDRQVPRERVLAVIGQHFRWNQALEVEISSWRSGRRTPATSCIASPSTAASRRAGYTSIGDRRRAEAVPEGQFTEGSRPGGGAAARARSWRRRQPEGEAAIWKSPPRADSPGTKFPDPAGGASVMRRRAAMGELETQVGTAMPAPDLRLENEYG